jgi:K+-transporting ATPase ATPase B chain
MKLHLLKRVFYHHFADETPEGKSIIELAETKGFKKPSLQKDKVHFVEFTAETRSSGIDMEGIHIRKGAYDSIRTKVEQAGNIVPAETMTQTKEIAANGGTPLVVSNNNIVTGCNRITGHHQTRHTGTF